ncbi:MAG: pyridoxal phosphate-dependent aminotransferase family protein [Campylobacterales bacterium]
MTQLYTHELEALKRAGRFRKRQLTNESFIDLASNDYLGFAARRDLFEAAYQRVAKYRYHAPRASMLVEGYHPLHQELEELLAHHYGMEAAAVVGSGFLANIALLEALPRRGDLVVIDEEFHASGILASKLSKAQVRFFKHNDAQSLLDEVNQAGQFARLIVVAEGVYSMGGDLCSLDVIKAAERLGALLILDEAHSGGVLGERLQGVLEHYRLTYDGPLVRMGTLGKAYGSYGAYLLSSHEIISFLENRAKPLIYSTALSLFDTALAIEGLLALEHEAKKLRKALDERLAAASTVTGQRHDSPIVMVHAASNASLMAAKATLAKNGFAVGAIRPPTTKRPMFRLIAGLGASIEEITRALVMARELSGC